MSAYAALTRVNYRVYTRDPMVIFFTFVFPLLFLVVLGLSFQGRDAITGVAAAILSYGTATTSLFGAAFALVQWRRDDILRLVRMTPTPLRSVLLARYLVSLTIAGLQVVLFSAVAVLPPFGLRPAASWPAALPVLALGVTAFLAIGVVIGSSTDTAEGVAAIANCVMVPMGFLSGAFVPVGLMPSWLRSVAALLPLHYLNSGVSAAISGNGVLAGSATACAGLGLFAVVFSVIGIRIFRWSNES